MPGIIGNAMPAGLTPIAGGTPANGPNSATAAPSQEANEPPEADEGSPADNASDASEAAGDSGSSLTITPQTVMSQLHLQPAQVAQVQRIVAAGMKVMFSPQTHKLMLQTMSGPGDIPTKLGQGIAGLIGLLMRESKNSIPPQLLVPAGMVLLADAADFVNKGGTPVTDQDVGNAVHIFVAILLHSVGVDSDKAAAAGAQAAQGGAAANAAAAPSAPTPPAGADDQVPPNAPNPATLPGSGLINSGMQSS